MHPHHVDHHAVKVGTIIVSVFFYVEVDKLLRCFFNQVEQMKILRRSSISQTSWR